MLTQKQAWNVVNSYISQIPTRNHTDRWVVSESKDAYEALWN
jgi:hypothetical protein